MLKSIRTRSLSPASIAAASPLDSRSYTYGPAGIYGRYYSIGDSAKEEGEGVDDIIGFDGVSTSHVHEDRLQMQIQSDVFYIANRVEPGLQSILRMLNIKLSRRFAQAADIALRGPHQHLAFFVQAANGPPHGTF